MAIFGLLPASLATGLGSDVQRPLATVIVWGLFSSTTLTLFVVPVFYRMLAPGLPRTEAASETSEAEARMMVEPLPDVPTVEIIRLIEHLHRPRRIAGHLPHLRRDQPAVRQRDRRGQGR